MSLKVETGKLQPFVSYMGPLKSTEVEKKMGDYAKKVWSHLKQDHGSDGCNECGEIAVAMVSLGMHPLTFKNDEGKSLYAVVETIKNDSFIQLFWKQATFMQRGFSFERFPMLYHEGQK